MPHYQGRCACCKEVFTETDDIVFCPICGAPYHRACYVKENGCIFTDKHTTGFEYSDPDFAPKQEQTTSQAGLCPKCQQPNVQGTLFCANCGTPLGKTQNNTYTNQTYSAPSSAPQMGGFPFIGSASVFPTPVPIHEIDGIPFQDWVSFIGPNHNSFLLRMATQQITGSKFNFSIFAFFLGPFYFAYRKMWGLAAIATIIDILLSIPAILIIMADASNPFVAGIPYSTLELLNSFTFYFNIVIKLFFGVFFLHYYREHAVKKIKQLRQQINDPFLYQTTLMQKGGTSVIGILAVLAVIAIFSMILAPIAGKDILNFYSTL